MRLRLVSWPWQGTPERSGEIIRCVDPLGMEPIGLGQGDKVRIGQCGSAFTGRIVTLLVHADGPVHPVIDYDKKDLELVMRDRCQLLRVHQEAAVASDRNDLP